METTPFDDWQIQRTKVERLQREYHDWLKLLKGVLFEMPLGVMIITHGSKIDYVNDRAIILLGDVSVRDVHIQELPLLCNLRDKDTNEIVTIDLLPPALTITSGKPYSSDTLLIGDNINIGMYSMMVNGGNKYRACLTLFDEVDRWKNIMTPITEKHN